ncbi:oplophorus-luciferin 2-monooxygenase non-catalytic subunit-like protein [Leptotrombidium deliense]|uniref:Oplophorus-luciferin 2-monooxygenase non-catalytic subunit-like protein n=1 Tax=Leptotrombidium deliense TaxID=299467 RepID=A0A443SAA8_9ACAR|nr:oplophorus-luciferin 2-monooxygenase non-catalytic subunit-like protein [Leptotrombidium deliense]
MSPMVEIFSVQRTHLNNSNTVLKAVNRLTNLETLILTDNEITKISNNSFNGKQRKLQTIELRNNNINDLDNFAFNDLPNVSSIDLDFNNISTIKNDTFVFRRKVNYILNIRLQNNNLNAKSFEVNSFANISPIVFLYLANNQIQYFDENVFKPIFEMKKDLVITAWNNPFRCDCKMKWLLENPFYLERITGIVCADRRSLWTYTVDQLLEC